MVVWTDINIGFHRQLAGPTLARLYSISVNGYES